jgi:hypothetical protein
VGLVSSSHIGYQDVVDGLHHDLEGEVVDGSHGYPHGWSVKILMSVTLSIDIGEEVVEALRRRHRTLS